MTCLTCGCVVVQVRRQTMDSPAEYECPVCDGGMSLAEVQRYAEFEDEAMDHYDEDDRHQPRGDE